MKVGLVHDYLLVMRGAERTFAAIADCWPRAPIHTTLYSAAGTEGRFRGRDVMTSWLQHLHPGQRHFRRLLPFYQGAVRRLPVRDYDLVVSSSSGFAHGVVTSPAAVHVCYCHTPFRYAWYERERALAEAPAPLRPGLGALLDLIRRRDLAAARRVTRFVANSELTRRRIRECYGREATVINPPVEIDRFEPASPSDYLLVVSELVPHKRIDVALEAARLAGHELKVVGSGPELARLQAEYGATAQFLGRIDDDELADLYSHALALVVPNVEEFGIAAVEAQAAGRPVVAIGAGGALETVLDGETGILVPGETPQDLARALADVQLRSFDPDKIRRHVQGFSVERFQNRLKGEVESALTA